MDKNGLSSFLMGLGVGVAIGMLFAPKSGQETRDMIKNNPSLGNPRNIKPGTTVRIQIPSAVPIESSSH